MDLNQWKRESAVNKELLKIQKQEKRLMNQALKAKPAGWKTELEHKIPEKVYTGLESAFCKAFSIVFNQGSVVIEKGFKKEDLQADFEARDYAVQIKGGRKELKNMRKSAGKSNTLNAALTTIEGVGLGALGIGIPDIVLFIGTLLKGIYETALNYGFEYESKKEQMLILKMMETALQTGDDWITENEEVDILLQNLDKEKNFSQSPITDDMFDHQIEATASAFAVDMLLIKFVQGLPIVGVLGGAANPVYYNKVMKYVQLKYQKRYLLKQKYFEM